MKIDDVESHKIFPHRLVIDFQYRSINWHRLLSVDIDYHRLSISSIGQAGESAVARGETSRGVRVQDFTREIEIEIEMSAAKNSPRISPRSRRDTKNLGGQKLAKNLGTISPRSRRDVENLGEM